MEALWLVHVDLLLKVTIDVRMGDVYRTQVEVLQGGERKHNANRRHAHSGSKGLKVIVARALGVPLCHQTSLVPLQSSVREELLCKDPA